MNPRTGDASAGDRNDALAELIREAGRRVAPPDAHYASVRDAARDAWLGKVARMRRRRRFGYAVAASVAIAASAALVAQLTVLRAPEPIGHLTALHGEVFSSITGSSAWEIVDEDSTVLGPGDRLRTESGAGAAFALANGVSLRIDSETELRLAAADAIELDNGRIYLDSGEGIQTRPVEISTALGVVSDIGTQFEVMSNESSLRVRVRTGLVRVSQSALGAALSSSAGEELELGARGDVARRPFRADDESWIWTQSLAIVPAADRASLRDYFRWISRETGRALEFDSSTTEYRAELESLNRSPDGLMPMELLDYIAAASNFSYELLEDGAILIHRN